jgi:thiol-disulfide isomerase/thioredoxin
MQLDLIAFIDSLDRIREGYSDSITFNGLSVLDSVFGAYADGYRQRILDSLAAAPQRLSNLLTQYHRIGREPVVDYSADKALFDGMKEALQEKYPMAPDVTVFSNQINEYREAQVFTDQVIDSEDKFQPGAYFPELFLQSVNGSSTHLKRNSLDNHVVLVWASWCSECRLQHISAIKEGADQSNWIYLSLDGLESQRNAVAEWQSAILQDGLEGLQLSDLGGQKSSVISTLGVRTLPLYFRVVDGKILKRTNSLQEALK